jgi:hypothetical protein
VCCGADWSGRELCVCLRGDEYLEAVGVEFVLEKMAAR